MLKGLFGSSLKIVQLVRIAHITSCCSTSASILLEKRLSFARNYATAVPNTKITTTSTLDFIIKELQNRARFRLRLLDTELQTVLANIKKQPVDSSVALEILRCCSYALTDENQSDIVHSIWMELKNDNNDFRIQHYNFYLKFASDKRNAKAAQDAFDGMVEAGIIPDATSYRCLLSAYCKAENIDKANEVCRIMDKNRININEHQFNHLAQCHIACGNVDAAKEIIANLKERKHKVNIRTLNSLLSRYAMAGDVENIKTTFDLFIAENFKLMNHVVLRVMCELAVNGYKPKIQALLPLLKPIEDGGTLQKSIIHFIENKQSAIVPQILQATDGNVRGMYRVLMQEMVRLSTDETEFNETMTNIEHLGLTTQLLESMFDDGSDQAKQIQDHVELNGHSQIGPMLKKLIQKQLTEKSKNQLDRQQMPDSTGKEKILFFAHIKDENIDEIEMMLTRGTFTLLGSDYALLVDLYARRGDIENALNMLKRARNRFTTFKLNRINVARLVTLMVEKKYDFSEIESLLRDHPQDKKDIRISFVDTLFIRLATNGEVQLIDKLFNVLMKYGYITPTVNSIKPIILAYLNNNFFAEAVAKYEYYAINHNVVSTARTLFIHLIQHKQIDLLQRAFDIDKSINGQRKASRLLASSFIRCNDDQRTRKILQQFHNDHRSNFIDTECAHYLVHGSIENAQTLLKATKGMKSNRFVIYECILNICEKRNLAQDAIDLWRQYYAEYQKMPSSDFQIKLVKLLNANNIEIPAELKKYSTK